MYKNENYKKFSPIKMFYEKVGIIANKYDVSETELSKFKLFLKEVKFKELHHSGSTTMEKIFHDLCKGKCKIIIHSTPHTKFKDHDVHVNNEVNDGVKDRNILKECDLILFLQNKGYDSYKKYRTSKEFIDF